MYPTRKPLVMVALPASLFARPFFLARLDQNAITYAGNVVEQDFPLMLNKNRFWDQEELAYAMKF